MTPLARDPDFVLEHSGFVRALARELVFDEELARDVEQETWLAALTNAPSGGSPRAWLAALVRNIAFKAWRGKLRRGDRELAVAREPRAVPTPAELLERENSRREIVDAVVALDEPWRSALIARYFEELSPEQAAQRLGVPLETLRTRLKRARELLRERLARRHGNFGSAAALALVRAWQLEPPSYFEVGAAAARSLIQGALVVAATHKLVIAAAAIVLVCASWSLWPRGSVTQPRVASDAAAGLPLTPPEQLAQSDAPPPLERVEVRAARAGEPVATAAPAARFGSLRLRVIWADDKTPAAGVWMRLHQQGADDYYRDTLEVRTDAAGLAFVERVFAGAVTAKFDRGSQTSARVDAGCTNEATLEIPAGFDVAGKVFDIDGRPFANAELYTQVFGGSHEGFVVAHSAADGSFAIRALQPKTATWVSARAPGRAPTKQRQCFGAAGTTLDIELAFEALGGVLEGSVQDGAGVPVGNARVLVGAEDGTTWNVLADGSYAKPPAAQMIRTDAAGAFRIDGVAAGVHALRARADGFAPWATEIEVVERGTQYVEVRLLEGASLSGTVRDQAGEPVAGLEVWANDDVGFASTCRVTRDDGSFEMRALPPGEVTVEVDGGPLGSAQTEIVLAVGAAARWDPFLSTGRTLHARVIAPQHDPATWLVTIEAEASAVDYSDTQATNADGQVEFVNCPDVTLRVSVRPKTLHAFPRAVLNGVRVGAHELAIELDPALEPSIVLRGRIVDPDGRPLGGVHLWPNNPALFYPPTSSSDAATGRFEIGPFPAGEWHICARPAGFAPLRSSAVHVDAGGRWDFGDLQVQRGGMVVARIEAPSGTSPSVFLHNATEGVQWLAVDGGEARSMLVAPGRYTLVARGEGLVDAETEVEVVAERETPAVLVLSKR